MSLYRETYRESTNGKTGKATLPSEFLEEFPSLCEVLQGAPKTSEDDFPLPPASIVVFAEAGKLKFVVTPKLGNQVGFGTFVDPVKGFADLESIIRAGKIDWRIGKKQNRS